MALRLSTGAKTRLANDIGLKEIFKAGFLDIYTGSQPSSPNYAETGTKLMRISVSSGTTGLTFGTAADGILPKSADVWSGVVSVGGVAGYFRLYDAAATTGTSGTANRIDGNVGVSGADLVLSSATLTATKTLTIDEFSLEVPTSA